MTEKKNDENGKKNGLYYPFYNPIGRYYPEEGVRFKTNGNKNEYVFEYEEGERTLLNIGRENPILIPKDFLLPEDLEMYEQLLKELKQHSEEPESKPRKQKWRRRGY